MRMGFRAGLLPDQFWSLTIAELLMAVEAKNERYKEDMEKLAWQTAHLLTPWSKRPVKPQRLLPWNNQNNERLAFKKGQHTKEQMRQLMRERIAAKQEAADGS